MKIIDFWFKFQTKLVITQVLVEVIKAIHHNSGKEHK